MATKHLGLCESDQYDKLKSYPTIPGANICDCLCADGNFHTPLLQAGGIKKNASGQINSYDCEFVLAGETKNFELTRYKTFLMYLDVPNTYTGSDWVTATLNGTKMHFMLNDWLFSETYTTMSTFGTKVTANLLVSGTYLCNILYLNPSWHNPSGWVIIIIAGPKLFHERLNQQRGYVQPNISSSEAAATAAKTAALNHCTALNAGAHFTWYLGTSNTANSPTLNINSLGAKPFYTADGNLISTNGSCLAKGLYRLFYNGSAFWILSGPIAYQKSLLGI
mgnify:CR=1 FL=1